MVRTSSAGVKGSVLFEELRLHRLQGEAKKKSINPMTWAFQSCVLSLFLSLSLSFFKRRLGVGRGRVMGF